MMAVMIVMGGGQLLLLGGGVTGGGGGFLLLGVSFSVAVRWLLFGWVGDRERERRVLLDYENS